MLLRSRWRLLRWGIAGALITLAVVWTRPALYPASAAFIPQGADPGRSGLASLAGQLGVSVSSGAATLTPDFYLRLVKSREVLGRLATDTLAVPELGGRRVAVEDLLHIGPGSPAEREDAAIEKLNKVVLATASKTTSVVEISAKAEWPSVALAFVNEILAGVNEFNTRTRRDQASAERKFIEARLAAATDDLRSSEDRLQQFLQGNRVVAVPDLQFARDRLQRDLALRQQVFASLTQAYDDVRMRELRDMPVITIVDQPAVAVKPEPRGRGIKTLIGFLLGVAVGAVIVFVGDRMRALRNGGDAAAADFVTAVDEVTGRVTRRLRRRASA